jgi:tetratricopeptide (TPR) repeat protein
MKAFVTLGILSALLGGDEKKPVPAVCPVDGTKFTGIEIAVTNQWGGLDADFCPHAFKTTPLEFYVWTCPSCGFTGRKKDFGAKFTDEEKQALRAGLKPGEPIRKGAKQAEIPGHVKYDLLAQAARIRGGPPEERGRAWLHAAWSCRQQGAVDLDDFDEWESLRADYGLQQTPMQLGKRNRTEFDLEVARKLAKDVEGRKYERGVNRILARYLLAHLYRKHGENADAERWLRELETLKGENSVVDDAAGRMRASIAREREFQKKAVEAYSEALQKGPAEPKAAPEIAYLVGELHRRTGDPQAAAEAYRKAIEGPGSSPALKDLALRQKALVEK